MSFAVLLLILASVSISSLAQITLKHGMSSSAMQSALGAGGLNAVLAIATNPFVIGGLALYAFGALIWLGVLAKIDVSMAYPFVAFGFVLTAILAAGILGEGVGLLRIAGTLLITVGAILVSRS